LTKRPGKIWKGMDLKVKKIKKKHRILSLLVIKYGVCDNSPQKFMLSLRERKKEQSLYPDFSHHSIVSG
jgi:uncharacterized membrane protein YfhO